MKIYKYSLPEKYGTGAIELPSNAVILSCGLDPTGRACIWAEVSTGPSTPTAGRIVHRVFTGDVVPAGEFVGTFNYGSLVFHVYIEGEIL